MDERVVLGENESFFLARFREGELGTALLDGHRRGPVSALHTAHSVCRLGRTLGVRRTEEQGALRGARLAGGGLQERGQSVCKREFTSIWIITEVTQGAHWNSTLRENITYYLLLYISSGKCIGIIN